jgi:protein-S-isoprenylcysteine O-methyltransferase Ste14
MAVTSRFIFLVPLVAGFALNSLSAFTGWYCAKLGETRGRQVTFILRNLLGIPLWAIGFALAARTPMRPLVAPSPARDLLAWCLIVGGAAVISLALVALRAKAAAPSPRDALIEVGPYARVRHPIHSGTGLEFIGLALLIPTPPVILSSMIGLTWLVVQSRLEEQDLMQRMPAYRDYVRRVPRFWPRFGTRT